jgi:hypothetical protein
VSELDLLVIQTDGLHIGNDLGAGRRVLGIDANVRSPWSKGQPRMPPSTARSVCRNVKRWRNARWHSAGRATGMLGATKGFRRLKAHRHLPILRAALAAHQCKYVTQSWTRR